MNTESISSQRVKTLYQNLTTSEVGTAEEIFPKAKADHVIVIYKEKLLPLGFDSKMELGCEE